MPKKSTCYGSTPQNDFNAQFRRVFEAAECNTQVELAALLEVKQSSISDAKRRETVPPEWFLKLFDKKRINPDWIRYGAGVKYLSAMGPEQYVPHVIRISEVRPPKKCSAQELFNELLRRALQHPDFEAFKRKIGEVAPPVDEMGDNKKP